MGFVYYVFDMGGFLLHCRIEHRLCKLNVGNDSDYDIQH